MRSGDEPRDEAEPVRITDRRRFTETGEARDGDAPPDAARTPREPQAAAGRAPRAAEPEAGPAPPRQGPSRDADGAAAGIDLQEIGIEAVFYFLWQSAVIALGGGPPESGDAQGQPSRVDLGEARQYIELLKIVEEKTAGNLSEQEASALRHFLHDAQLRYVHVASDRPRAGA